MYRSIKKNWMRTILAVAALTLASAVACGAASGTDKPGGNTPLQPTQYNPNLSLAPLVEKVAPAVVNIKVTMKARRNSLGTTDFFDFFFGQRGPGRRERPGTPREKQAVGSGFIIDKKGLVVTNHHVVAEADEIEVQLADDRTFKAVRVGSDERTDVALLKLTDAKKLPTVPLGNSDALKVGDHVVAIGNPFGLGHTVTSGIVSAKERVINAGPYDDFIQTDASINPGNSGGPLFNLSGEVIGINTAIAPQGQGIGFAIPSTMALSIVDSLNDGGKVVRGWLGVGLQAMDNELAKALGTKDTAGALVTNVTDDSPAQKGGLLTRDVILEVHGRKIKDSRHLASVVANLKPGTTTKIQVVRDGKKKTLKIGIGQMPDEYGGYSSKPTEGNHVTDLGLTVKELDDPTRNRLGAEKVKGVLVTGVDSNSPAAGYLRPGDIIVEVNRNRVGTPTEFKTRTKDLKTGDDVLLLVYQKGTWRYLTFRLK